MENRRDFLKNMILLGAGTAILPQLWTAKAAEALGVNQSTVSRILSKYDT